MTEAKKRAGESPSELLDGNGLKIGIAVARFNSDITYQMRDLCLDRLSELGVKVDESHIFEVPGSFELPLAARALLDPASRIGRSDSHRRCYPRRNRPLPAHLKRCFYRTPKSLGRLAQTSDIRRTDHGYS